MSATGGVKRSIYRVGGLKGDHCRDRIEHTLSHLGGVTEVGVDLEDKTVEVVYDTNVIAGGYIEETLQSLGYSIQG
jgi:copper chaperone CopZ